MIEEFNEKAKNKLLEANVWTTKCRDCGVEIWFLKNTIGKFTPMELNLEIHRCPNKQQRSNGGFDRKPGHTRDRGWDRGEESRW